MPVELSSGESRGEEEEEEEDSEMTPEGTAKISPLIKADNLHTFPDDVEADARQEKEEPPVIPTRDRSTLISRDAASAPAPPGAASGLAATPASTPGASTPAPRVVKLSGFKLLKRRDYVAADQ